MTKTAGYLNIQLDRCLIGLYKVIVRNFYKFIMSETVDETSEWNKTSK